MTKETCPEQAGCVSAPLPATQADQRSLQPSSEGPFRDISRFVVTAKRTFHYLDKSFSSPNHHQSSPRTGDDKYAAGYAAKGMRHAFLPAVVSTSGRMHGELLRLLYILADRKTPCTSGPWVRPSMWTLRLTQPYCWHRSGFFWRMRASYGLACAQATTLHTEVVGKACSRPR